MSRRTIPASGRTASPRLVIRPGTRRVHDAPPFRPRMALLAVGVLSLLLLEVWQTSTVASLSVRVGRSVHELQQASAERAWTASRLEQSSSRSELGPVAGALGLQPVDPRQIVTLPEEYLEPAPARQTSSPSAPLLALAGRALDALVPDAAARGRHVN
jgi:hypothetical protein